MTGKKPTQAQFWATFSSFRHKAESIAQSDIANLSNTLNSKAEKSQFDAHMTDPNAHAESIGGKLDKASYPGNAEDLDRRIAAVEMPDRVLKYGTITMTGLNLSIAANAFAWVLYRNQFLNPPAFSSPISAATAGKYRNNIVVGNQVGTYEIVQGNEASTGGAAAEPPVPPGTIKVGYFLVFGSTIADSGNSDDSDPFAGEIRFPAYPNTRNDGQLPTNKILSTDANGFLKLYTIATSPPPYMEVLIPESTLPSTTTNFTIKGAFFTPSMTVSIVGQTINYLTFLSDNLIKVNVTTGAVEGNFAVTLNNGLSSTYPSALLIVLGDVYIPKTSEWISLTGTPNVETDGEFHLSTYASPCSAVWNKTIDGTKKIGIEFSPARTPFNTAFSHDYSEQYFEFTDLVNGNVYKIGTRLESGDYWSMTFYKNGVAIGLSIAITNNVGGNPQPLYKVMMYSGNIYFFSDNVLKYTVNGEMGNAMTMKVRVQYYDYVKIKYIEYAS